MNDHRGQSYFTRHTLPPSNIPPSSQLSQLPPPLIPSRLLLPLSRKISLPQQEHSQLGLLGRRVLPPATVPISIRPHLLTSRRAGISNYSTRKGEKIRMDMKKLSLRLPLLILMNTCIRHPWLEKRMDEQMRTKMTILLLGRY